MVPNQLASAEHRPRSVVNDPAPIVCQVSTASYIPKTVVSRLNMSASKVVLITASSAGVGAQVARAFAPDFRVVRSTS